LDFAFDPIHFHVGVKADDRAKYREFAFRLFELVALHRFGNRGSFFFWHEDLALLELNRNVAFTGKLVESVEGRKYVGGFASQAEVIENGNYEDSWVFDRGLVKTSPECQLHTRVSQIRTLGGHLRTT